MRKVGAASTPFMKQKYFELAKKLSIKSSHHTHKMGCVVVNKNEIVGIGFNQIKTHPKSPHPFKTLHAEISAILGVSYRDLKGCTVYVYRETKDGKPAMAKPCQVCEQALKNVGIKKVYFSVDNDKGWDYTEYC